MGYSRIDVNLLPQELQPGPVVRYGFIINIAIVAATVTFLVLDGILTFTKLSMERALTVELQNEIGSLDQVVEDRERLQTIEESVHRYAQMVNLAALEYVDIPIVLDRLSRIIPDGVFLTRVAIDRAAGSSQSAAVHIDLMTSRRDEQLLLRAVKAFKEDSIFHDCVMRYAAYEEADLANLLEDSDITWNVSGPDISTDISAEQYEFQMLVNLVMPISSEGIPVGYDGTPHYEHVLTQGSPEGLPAADSAGREGAQSGQETGSE